MATGFGRYTPGQGFQSVAPNRPSGAVGGALGSAINRGGTPTGGSGSSGGGSSRGGGGGGTTQPNLPKVDIKGNEVFIDGVGYSVKQGEMSSFLASKGFSGSPVYSKQLEAAKKADTAYKTDVQLRKDAGLIKTQLLSDYPTLERTRNVDLIARNLASGKMTDFGGKDYAAGLPKVKTFQDFTAQQPLVSRIQEQNEKFNTVMILADENGNAKGIEYGGQSLTLQGFQNKYGVKLLQDPKTNEFFFGTVGAPDGRKPSSISGDFKKITDKELNDVQKTLFRAKIKELAIKGPLGVVSDSKVGKYLEKEGTWAYDKIIMTGSNKINELSQAARKTADEIIKQSDLDYYNKKNSNIKDLAMRGLSLQSYFVGSAAGYGLSMISGIGNNAWSLVLKPKQIDARAIILASPAIIKASIGEINRTVRGTGNIDDFFGSALTLASLATTAAGFYKLNKGLKGAKMNKILKKDFPLIKKSVIKTQKLLKTQELFSQKVFMQNSKKWKTFGNAWQETNKMNAKHSWHALSNEKASVILQKSIITDGNVKMINLMVAKSTSQKVLAILSKVINKKGASLTVDRFLNNNKVASYLSKVRASRAYTLFQFKDKPYTIAIDGKGATHILYNNAQLRNFIKNAKFGKFSFTGKRVVGGNIETIINTGNGKFTGTEMLSRTAFRKSIGRTKIVQKALEDKTGKVIKYKGGKKTPFTKTFGQVQEISQVQKQVSLPKNIALSKGVRGSVVGSQLKSVTKAIQKTIAKNDLALKAGFRAVVAPSGLMFFSRTGKLVSAREATEASNKNINRTVGAIKNILSENTSQTPVTRISQASSQKSGQTSAQKSAQQSKQQQLERMQQASARSARTGFKVQMKPFEPKFKLPELDKRKNATIVKKILGDKLAPSYQIVIGSGKKVKKIGGRLSPAEAISKGAYTIDRTKERTVRIVPTKQKPNARFKINYLKQAGQKFRNFRYKNKKRVSYSSTRLIEKRRFFNDMPNEIRRKKIKR